MTIEFYFNNDGETAAKHFHHNWNLNKPSDIEAIKNDLRNVSLLIQQLTMCAYYGNFYTVADTMLGTEKGFKIPLGALIGNKMPASPKDEKATVIGFPPSLAGYLSRSHKKIAGDLGKSITEANLLTVTTTLLKAICKNAIPAEYVNLFRNSLIAGILELYSYRDVRANSIISEEELTAAFNELPSVSINFTNDNFVEGYFYEDAAENLSLSKVHFKITFREITACGRLVASMLYFVTRSEDREKLESIVYSCHSYLEKYLDFDMKAFDTAFKVQLIDDSEEVERFNEIYSNLADSLIYNEFDYKDLQKVVQFCINHIEQSYTPGINLMVMCQFCLAVVAHELAKLLSEPKSTKTRKKTNDTTQPEPS